MLDEYETEYETEYAPAKGWRWFLGEAYWRFLHYSISVMLLLICCAFWVLLGIWLAHLI
jgi:hypothetical protein